MPDLSNIPFGPGVELWNGLNKNLEVLFDPNRATYKINSSRSEWSVLFIRAKKEPSALADPYGWQFTLESDTVANVAKVFDKTDPAYDPPRIVNKDAAAIPVADNEQKATITDYIGSPATKTAYPVSFTLPGWTGSVDLTIETEVKYRLHWVDEVGTYIMPIAYHKATDAGLDIRQVARSDWSFWPVPLHAVWSRAEEVVEFKVDAACG